ncbi:MAG: hypothetical protein P8J50_05680 [Acidimicrobiales bacterium]|nr:hypothetical protein [Acidimicrobiales bacterium]
MALRCAGGADLMGGPTRREWGIGVVVGALLLVGAFVAYAWWDLEGSWNGRAAVGYEIRGDDETVLLVYGGCNPEVRARVTGRTDERVLVIIETRRERKGDCLMGGEVTLSSPLGDRRVVDPYSGATLQLQPN